jgi:nucleotidyltransferase AbiEii toxin of type IV toxin-antitoxin system
VRHFSPHLEILPPPQRKLWSELSEVSREFVLYGGTALALHLGHRSSVDFDFFGSRALDLSQIEQGIAFLSAPEVAEDNGLDVASLLDLAGTKASVVQMRAEAKDYIDIDALITAGKVDLPLAIAAAQRLYGSTFNPQITLKALSFFDDGDLSQLPQETKLRLAMAAREVDLDRLPSIDKFTRQIDRNCGYDL